jgi:hypothetical protein
MSYPLYNKEKVGHQLLSLYEVLNLIRSNKKREILAILADAPRAYKTIEIVEVIYKDVPFGVGRKMSKQPEFTTEFDKNVAMRECEANRISTTNQCLLALTKAKLLICEEVPVAGQGMYPKFYSINPNMHECLVNVLDLYVVAKSRTPAPATIPRKGAFKKKNIPTLE